jgi:hypothetical protein
MKWLRKFNESVGGAKYLIQLSSANSLGIMNYLDTASESQKVEAEKWWSLNVDSIVKLEMNVSPRFAYRIYANLSNDILTKLIASKTDVERFGPSYLMEITGLTPQEVQRFRWRGVMDDNCGKLYDRLSRILNKFKRLKLDQKISFYRELESDDYLILRSSYIYKVVDESELEFELASMVNKFQIISQE